MIETHIIITGICALLTTQGVPTKIVLPDARAKTEKHIAWLLFPKDSVKDPDSAIFKIPKLDDDDPNDTEGKKWRYVEIDQEAIAIGNVDNTATTVNVGRPTDPVNASGTKTDFFMHWVADLRRLVKKSRQDLAQDPELIATMAVPGGDFAARGLPLDCVWELKPGSPKPYKQGLAEEVDWKVDVKGTTVTIVLTKFDGASHRQLVAIPTNDKLTFFLGNTPERDILPKGTEDCDKNETEDKHFLIYYDLLDDPPSKQPYPHKVSIQISSEFGTESMEKASQRVRKFTPPIRGGGGNCPPLLAEGDIPTPTNVRSTAAIPALETAGPTDKGH